MPEAPLDPSHDWNADFRLEVYRRADGDWGWRPVSVHNGQVLTPEGYRNKGFLLDLLGRLFPQAAQPVEVEAPQLTWTVADFDPDDAAPKGDPDLDCTGETFGS